MAKTGKSGKSENISQRHLHCRISYLYQAAVYLDTVELNVGKAPLERRKVDMGESVGSRAAEATSTVAERFDDRSASTEKETKKAKLCDRRLGCGRKLEPLQGPSPLTHHLLASMRSISQKSQIRLAQSIKRSVCRRCNQLLTLHSSAEIENLSRERKKPRADVLVVRCCRCGSAKRYSVGLGESRNGETKKTDGDVAGTPKEEGQ